MHSLPCLLVIYEVWLISVCPFWFKCYISRHLILSECYNQSESQFLKGSISDQSVVLVFLAISDSDNSVFRFKDSTILKYVQTKHENQY